MFYRVDQHHHHPASTSGWSPLTFAGPSCVVPIHRGPLRLAACRQASYAMMKPPGQSHWTLGRTWEPGEDDGGLHQSDINLPLLLRKEAKKWVRWVSVSCLFSPSPHVRNQLTCGFWCLNPSCSLWIDESQPQAVLDKSICVCLNVLCRPAGCHHLPGGN